MKLDDGWNRLKKLLRYRMNAHQDTHPLGIDAPKLVGRFFDRYGIKRIYRFTFLTILITSLLTGSVFYYLFITVSKGINVTVTNKIEQPALPTQDPFKDEPDEASSETARSSDSASSENCEVAIMTLQGPLVPHITPNPAVFSSEEEQTASEEICWKIEKADQDSQVRAIVVEVDSPGGYPLAAEEIEQCIKRSKKQVVAYIRSSGTSAAYWAITSADRIFASTLSDIGSIGVYISYLDNVEKNKKEGLKYHLYSTGKFKDMLSPDRPTTLEEENLIMSQLQSAHGIFVKTVSENRKIGMETVKQIADGRVFDGEQAVLIGLIDEIGGLYEVKKFLVEHHVVNENPSVCYY